MRFYTSAHIMISHLKKHNELIRRLLDDTPTNRAATNVPSSEFIIVQGGDIEKHTQTLLTVYEELKNTHSIFGEMIGSKA